MSLLDKQEVQDICEHTALRARKWSGFICKRASEDVLCYLVACHIDYFLSVAYIYQMEK